MEGRNSIDPCCGGICGICNEPNNCGFIIGTNPERRCKWDSPGEVRPQYTRCVSKTKRNGRGWPMYIDCTFFDDPGFEEKYAKAGCNPTTE